MNQVVGHIVHEVVQKYPEVRAVQENISEMLSGAINIEVEALVKKRIEHVLIPAVVKDALQAELRLAKDVFAIKVSIIKEIKKHIKRRSTWFQNLEGLLESACIDGGEDSLGAGGPLTDLLNFAHSMNDEDKKMFKQITKDLKHGIVSKQLIQEMENDLVEMELKKEGATK